ncbi:MAG: radical SAM family heme chaperone HemW [Bdellovibrionaceae bacterium]|nr:radical SAM family heme chaperone HemW [Pseudobdellovibrionaceae bacterium]
MSFGVYVHIPYCIQRCTYCDFATYEQTKILPPTDYTQLLIKEINLKKQFFLQGKESQFIDTLYFGGGTPSLFAIKNIVQIINALASAGYLVSPDAELTMEINPGTVDENKLNEYLKLGFNRFSVGAQTFNSAHLKRVHREHSVDDTRKSLGLLKKYNLNYNFDLLFGMPYQTIAELDHDLSQALAIEPPHVSPYYLTVPEGHPLSKNRPIEDEQMVMFERIESALSSAGYHRYEISNYARPGFESKHNYLYWSDQEYWGIGLGSHSYLKRSTHSAWGQRFWNPNNIKIYQQEIEALKALHSPAELADIYFENLKENQSLTDFCHTSLRRAKGLILSDLKNKFSTSSIEKVDAQLNQLSQRGLVQATDHGYTLTSQGKLISNWVFEKLTFT